jgi:hypothetical protein
MKRSVIAALVLGLAWFASPDYAEAGMNHPPHSTKKFMGVDREWRSGEEIANDQSEGIERAASKDEEEKRRGTSRRVKHKWGMP